MYLNQIFTISREVKDHVTGVVTTSADYGELGLLLAMVTVIGFLLPMSAIVLVKKSRLKGVGDR